MKKENINDKDLALPVPARSEFENYSKQEKTDYYAQLLNDVFYSEHYDNYLSIGNLFYENEVDLSDYEVFFHKYNSAYSYRFDVQFENDVLIIGFKFDDVLNDDLLFRLKASCDVFVTYDFKANNTQPPLTKEEFLNFEKEYMQDVLFAFRNKIIAVFRYLKETDFFNRLISLDASFDDLQANNFNLFYAISKQKSDVFTFYKNEEDETSNDILSSSNLGIKYYTDDIILDTFCNLADPIYKNRKTMHLIVQEENNNLNNASSPNSLNVSSKTNYKVIISNPYLELGLMNTIDNSVYSCVLELNKYFANQDNNFKDFYSLLELIQKNRLPAYVVSCFYAVSDVFGDIVTNYEVSEDASFSFYNVLQKLNDSEFNKLLNKQFANNDLIDLAFMLTNNEVKQTRKKILQEKYTNISINHHFANTQYEQLIYLFFYYWFFNALDVESSNVGHFLLFYEEQLKELYKNIQYYLTETFNDNKKEEESKRRLN